MDEDVISEYFVENFKGDCLLAVGDEELIKIHFHTNEPWKVLEYCASLGEIFDIVVKENLLTNTPKCAAVIIPTRMPGGGGTATRKTDTSAILYTCSVPEIIPLK